MADIAELRVLHDRLKAVMVEPRPCTAEEADAQNRLMELTGVPFTRLKAGDLVYVAWMHPSVGSR